MPVDIAILRTLVYADVFNFALTLEEIHHFLICNEPVALAQVEQALATSPQLAEQVHHSAPYYMLKGRQDLAALRHTRATYVRPLMAQACEYGRYLSQLPFVRMVAITGALAAQNPSSPQDDLDFFLLVEPRRVWLARAFAIVIVRYGRLRRVAVCPNYVLACDRLTQRRQDLFIAREISQMHPLYGYTLYERFRAENVWSCAFMSNAQAPFYPLAPLATQDSWLKRALEFVLGGKLGDWLEDWEYRRKARRFVPKLQQAQSAAEIDKDRVKGHFNDYGTPALQRYEQRLAQYDIPPQ